MGASRKIWKFSKRILKNYLLCLTCQISIVSGEVDYLAWILCFEIWNQSVVFLLWQLPLRDFAVLTSHSRFVWKEINPWWVAEEAEMRSLASGSDGALKLCLALHDHVGRSGVTWSPNHCLPAPTWRLIILLEAWFSVMLLERLSGVSSGEHHRISCSKW